MITLGWEAEAEVDAGVAGVGAVGMVEVDGVDGWRNVGKIG